MGRTKLQPVELVEDTLTDGLSVNLNAMTEHRLEIMQSSVMVCHMNVNVLSMRHVFTWLRVLRPCWRLVKRLVILKENEPHGDFTNILENDLGLAPQVARRMMQASVKFWVMLMIIQSAQR